MCPAILSPLMTCPGLVPEPMDPGARWRSDWPWVLGPPEKWWGFTTPANPRPLQVVIPVFRFRLDLSDQARPSLHRRHRLGAAVGPEHLGHAYLLPQESA